MTKKQDLAPDDVSSAPESGTICDDTSGNKPSDRGCDPRHMASQDDKLKKDDPSIAGEEHEKIDYCGKNAAFQSL